MATNLLCLESRRFAPWSAKPSRPTKVSKPFKLPTTARRSAQSVAAESAADATASIPGWRTAFPWLRAGTTRRPRRPGPSRPVTGARPNPAPDEAGLAVARWAGADIPAHAVSRLDGGRAWRSVLRSRQVHGRRVRVHDAAPRGFVLAGDCDGHATRAPGLLLTVTLADCVPVFVADPTRSAVALLHAGWRGTAAGVLESGFSAMAEAFGSRAADLSVHLGPSICGQCYEVGPEVFSAVGQPAPPSAAPLDLRAVLVGRAVSAGVGDDRVSASRECTRCGAGRRYFSHRRGDRGRHLAYLGILPRAGLDAEAGRTAASGGVPARSPSDPVGLCRDCAWSRRVETARGSVFRLCRRHRSDPAYRKYPTLPVVRCPGFEVRRPDPGAPPEPGARPA